MDQAEVPLSPLRQLSLITLLKQVEKQDAQFIIATHSPILVAFPDANIFSFDVLPLQPVAYEALEHVTLTQAFLKYPQAYLRHL